MCAVAILPVLCSFALLFSSSIPILLSLFLSSCPLQVNHSPSMNIDTPLDFQTKHKLVSDVWRIINLRNNNRWKMHAMDKEKQQQVQHKNKFVIF